MSVSMSMFMSVSSPVQWLALSAKSVVQSVCYRLALDEGGVKGDAMKR